jgi:DNA uptake protein ComE-like DNA-binding protein
VPTLKQILPIALLAGLGIGCAQKKESPDDIRQETANATAEVKANAKAVVEGVKEGLHRGNTVDLNKSSKDDLLNLPGMTSDRADRVIAARPYDDPHQLVSRHILSGTEYDRIKDQVTATR